MKTDLSLLEAMDIALDLIREKDAAQYLAEIKEKADGPVACFLKDTDCSPDEALGQRVRAPKLKWAMEFSESELSHNNHISINEATSDTVGSLEFSKEFLMEGMLASMSLANERLVAA